MEKDWNEIFAGRRHGINLVVLDEVTGSVLKSENYDTYQTSLSFQLARTIEQIQPGRIVCAAVGFGPGSLNVAAKRALMLLGSDKTDKLTSGFFGSWALIGVKGAPRGRSIEKLLSSSSVHLSAQIRLKPSRQPIIEITAESAGHAHGNYAIIKVNDSVVNISYTGYIRGLNVVIIDEKTGVVLDSRIFDTSAEATVYSPSDQFVDLVTCQPEGRIVVVAIKDEGVDHLSESAKEACESIGSAMIWQVSHGGAWAIIGSKNRFCA